MALEKVKKGDALAYIKRMGVFEPASAVKVVCSKHTKANVWFEHNGEQVKVNLDGRGLLGGWVEPWDDAREETRARAHRLYHIEKRLQAVQAPIYPDTVRLDAETALLPSTEVTLSELEHLRAEFIRHTSEALKGLT